MNNEEWLHSIKQKKVPKTIVPMGNCFRCNQFFQLESSSQKFCNVCQEYMIKIDQVPKHPKTKEDFSNWQKNTQVVTNGWIGSKYPKEWNNLSYIENNPKKSNEDTEEWSAHDHWRARMWGY